MVISARNVLLQGIDLVGNGRRSNIMSFEANLDFEVRFMADIDLVGCGWVEVPVRKWAEIDRLRKQTHCQLEVCKASESSNERGALPARHRNMLLL